MDRYADLDELVAQCRGAAARERIREAVAAYRSGALRASVAACWVAVVYDLIDKLRELAISGNSEAQVQVDKLDRIVEAAAQGSPDAVGRAQKFETGLLALVRDKFDLLDQHQFLDMLRLKEDRNRCAHPTFQFAGEPYVPSPEAVRLHLRNAMTQVLHLPPLQGRSATSEILRMVTSQYFPRTVAGAAPVLEHSPVRHPSSGMLKAVIFELLEGYCDSGQATLYRKRSVAAAIGSIVHLHSGPALELVVTWIESSLSSLDDREMPALLGLVSVVPGCWAESKPKLRTRLREFVLHCDVRGGDKWLGYAGQVADLRELLVGRAPGLDDDGLAALIEAGIETELVEEVVSRYCAVGSFPDANSVYRKLVDPLFVELSSGQVNRILRAPKESGADLSGSFGFEEFVARLRREGPLGLEELNGVLIEQGLELYVDAKGEGGNAD